jgi:hypothetical protein
MQAQAGGTGWRRLFADALFVSSSLAITPRFALEAFIHRARDTTVYSSGDGALPDRAKRGDVQRSAWGASTHCQNRWTSTRRWRFDWLLTIILAVIAAIEEDPKKEGVDFTRIQVAKAICRRKGAAGHQSGRQENHPWTESRGRSLLALGEIMVKTCAPAIQRHLAGVLSRKIRRFGRRRRGEDIAEPLARRLAH